jgi:hypothetical protein
MGVWQLDSVSASRDLPHQVPACPQWLPDGLLYFNFTKLSVWRSEDELQCSAKTPPADKVAEKFKLLLQKGPFVRGSLEFNSGGYSTIDEKGRASSSYLIKHAPIVLAVPNLERANLHFTPG